METSQFVLSEFGQHNVDGPNDASASKCVSNKKTRWTVPEIGCGKRNPERCASRAVRQYFEEARPIPILGNSQNPLVNLTADPSVRDSHMQKRKSV
jgi:hypothetical protein